MLIHHSRFLTHTASTFPAHSARLRRWRLKHSEGIVGSTCSRRNLIRERRRTESWESFRCWADKNMKSTVKEISRAIHTTCYAITRFEGHRGRRPVTCGLPERALSNLTRRVRGDYLNPRDLLAEEVKVEVRWWKTKIACEAPFRTSVTELRHAARSATQWTVDFIISNPRRQLLWASNSSKNLPSSP